MHVGISNSRVSTTRGKSEEDLPSTIPGRERYIKLRQPGSQALSDQSLSDAEARLRSVMEDPVDRILTINEQSIIESINKAGVLAFRFSQHELISEKMTTPIAEEYQP